MQNAYYAITEFPSTAADIAREIYGKGDNTRIQHFFQLNRITENLPIEPGTILVVPITTSTSCTLEETRLADSLIGLRRREDTPTPLITHPRTANKIHEQITTYVGGGLGAYSYTLGLRVKEVEKILRELQQLYKTTYRTTGGLSGALFIQRRQQIMYRLDRVLKGQMRTALLGHGDISVRRGLGISTSRTIHRWNSNGASTGIPDLNKRVSRLNSLSQTAKRLGYIGMGLDVAWSVTEINRHIEENKNDRNRQIAGETGRLAGSITGGVAGGYIGGTAGAYLVCNLIIGLPSGGTSLFWCGVAVGGAGAFAGGYMGSAVGPDVGHMIYDSRAR